MKHIGFARGKLDKYDKTPYKRWLADRRQGYEVFWQQKADELLGKDTRASLKTPIQAEKNIV